MPADPWDHELAVAQLEGEALALERLAAARAAVEAAPAGVAISPGQLRLVVGA